MPAGDATLGVQVADGEVTLTGRLPGSVPAELAVRLARAVPGVVGASAAFTAVAS
ncbi:BON domain-containing protein [Streptomyces sp. NPDC051771]|uniref:BON domain-containing protein n=1 Tax=Streptomyces sp. NPDC051771 TaxID=3154847 RepID=UPI00342697FD